MRAICLLLLLGLPAGAQERGRVADLQWKVVDLQFRVTDYAGNLVDLAGRIEDMRVVETPTEITIDLAADVLFEFDKATLLPAAEETLSKAAVFIREGARGAVRIEGHTDAKGDDNYNLQLSRKRAESVRDWFLARGNTGGAQFAVEGMGEKKPVAANAKPDGSDDAAGRQKNRRVQIVISR